MSDPFETLRQEPAMDRPPADEVRRLGDRRRNRRTALQAGAAALAVVAVVGGAAIGSGVVDSSGPEPPPASQGPSPDAPETSEPPEPAPTKVVDPDVITAIPADFPLADGYPEVTGVDQVLRGPAPDVEAFTDVSACDRTWERLPHENRLATTFSQPEDYRGRELTTYASESDALDQLARIVTLYEGCPRETIEGSPQTVVQVEPGAFGATSYTITRHFEKDGGYVPGIEVIVAVQVNNALLLSSESSEDGGSPAGVRQAGRESDRAISGVVGAMCVFAADGCGEETPTATTRSLLSRSDVQEITGFSTTWAASVTGFESDDCREIVPSAIVERGAAAAVHEGQSPDDPQIVNARVVSAVAAFRSERAATAAFDEAVREAGECRSAQEMISEGTEGTGGSGDDTTYWRLIAAPAPEVCTQCGASWLHGIGLVQVGDRVAAINVSWIGDLEMVVGSDDPAPLPQLLARAAERAPAE